MPMSNCRASVVKVGHSLLLLLLLTLILVPQRQAQNIPHRHSNTVRDKELESFHNSHILIKERESDVYLYKGVSRNFTFTISHNCTIIVTLTPCASEIYWTLYFLARTHSELSWIGEQHHSLSRSHQLAQFSSDKRETVLANANVGTYVLTATSLHSDSHVKIFVSSSPEVGGSLYPSVPANSQINVLTNRKTLILDWSSGTAVNRYRRSLEYCIVVSRIKNFQSYCGALAHAHGDTKPVFVDWNFSSEKEKFEELLNLANPVKPAPSKMIFHRCVGNKTSYTFTRVKRGKTYYVDVFAVDKDTNMASSYTGTTAKIKYRKVSPKTKMKVGETRTINLKRKMAIEININSTLPKLAFEVVPCSAKIHYELYYNGKKNQTKTLARRWKRLVVRDAGPGTYLLTFPGKKKKTFVTVFITSNPSRSRIVVPKKRKIRVFGKLTTCSNVTVAWMGSSVEQNYCLYKKKLTKDGLDSRRRRCLSPAERPEADRVMCTSFSSADTAIRRAITYNVTGLHPDTWYRFDVFVRRGRSARVPYKSVKVKTLAQCLS